MCIRDSVFTERTEKCLWTARYYAFSCYIVGFNRVFISRIMREVAADNKKVFRSEPWSKGLSNLLNRFFIISANNNRYNGWDILKIILNERYLILDTMFLDMSSYRKVEHLIIHNELIGNFFIHRNFSQRGNIIATIVHRSAVKIHYVT